MSVQNQYVFIHEAALGSLISMKGVSSVDKFRQQYDSLINDQQRLQREFQVGYSGPIERLHEANMEGKSG